MERSSWVLLSILLTAALLFTYLLTVSSQTAYGDTSPSVLGSITDPEHSGIDAFVDILSARVEQDRGFLTFYIETRGNIPTGLTRPEDTITYLWLIDADNKPGTGQPHGDVGSEFNVRAVIGGGGIAGFVDVTGSVPGGGTGDVRLQGNRIEITIGLSQIASPAQFHWRSETFQMVNGVHTPGNLATAVAAANPMPWLAPAHVRLVPPLLMLSISGSATGSLTVEIRDAQGNLLDNDDYKLVFSSSNPAVASVDASGNVTAHAVPVNFFDTPYVSVSASGVLGDNKTVIRVTGSNLGVTHQAYSGSHISFYLPASIEGVDLNSITTNYQVVQATDMAYIAEQNVTCVTPFRGGRQYFVLDVTDDERTAPCGLSGNPVRLGWTYGKPIHNSCYIINATENRVPQWGVIFHEMGHNFTSACFSFNQFCKIPSTPLSVTYSEGLATLAGMWSWKDIKQNGTSLSQLARNDIDANFTNSENVFRQSLANYRNAGAVYSTLDANMLDGILLEMYDTYGTDIWYDLFSTFLPADQPLPVTLDTTVKQATWFVAAGSASTGLDLRSTLAQRYGFPIDDAAWPSILTSVQARINVRKTPMNIQGDANGNGILDAVDITKVERIIAGLDASSAGADANRDSSVNSQDITKIERLIARLD